MVITTMSCQSEKLSLASNTRDAAGSELLIGRKLNKSSKSNKLLSERNVKKEKEKENQLEDSRSRREPKPKLALIKLSHENKPNRAPNLI